MAHISEYEVETKFIDRLESIGYEYVELKNYNDVIDNFRKQLTRFNEAKIKEAIPTKKSIKTFPKQVPRPNSIYSNCV